MKSKQATCAVLGMAVFLTFSLFHAGCGGGSEEESSVKKVKVDWQDKLEEKIKFELPAHLTLVSAVVTDTFDASTGDYKMTEFKFTATVKTSMDLYSDRLERDDRNNVRLAELLIAKGETVKVEGKGMHSKEMFNINLPYKAFDKLGVARAEIESKAGSATLLIKGSEEANALYAAIENEKREKEAARQAVLDAHQAKFEARKAEQEAQSQAYLAEVEAMQKAREAEKQAIENAKVASLQNAIKEFTQVYEQNGVIHFSRTDTGYKSGEHIYSITDIEKSEGDSTWRAILHNPAAPGKSVCEIVWRQGREFGGVREEFELVPVSVAWGNPAIDGALRFRWNPEERTYTNFKNRKPVYVLHLNPSEQELAQKSIDGLLQPWGKVELDPDKQVIIDGRLVELQSGRILATVGHRNLVPSELATGALATAGGWHYYPSAFAVYRANAATITAPMEIPKVTGRRNNEGFLLVLVNAKTRIYEKGGDIYVREVSDDFTEYRRLTDYGIFGSAVRPSSPSGPIFITGDFLYVFGSNPKVRIHLKSGELVEVDKLPASTAFLSERPVIMNRYNAVFKDDILFLYDYVKGEELRLDPSVLSGGLGHDKKGGFNIYSGKFVPDAWIEISEGVYYLKATRAVIDFKSMSAYSLRETARGAIPENLLNQSNGYKQSLALMTRSPSSRFALFRAMDKDNFEPVKGFTKFFLVDLTDGSVVREMDGEMDRIFRAASKWNWITDNLATLAITKGDLDQIGLWALDVFTGRTQKIHKRVTDVVDVAYQAEQNRLFLLTNNAGDKGLVAVNIETGDQYEYPAVEGVQGDPHGRVAVLHAAMPESPSISIVGKRLTGDSLATTAESFEADYAARGQHHPAIAAIIFTDKEFGNMIRKPVDGLDYVRAVDAVIDYLFGERALRRNAVVQQQIIAKTPELEAYLKDGKTVEQVRAFHRKGYAELLKSVALKQALPMSLNKGLTGDQLQNAFKTVDATLAGMKGGVAYPQNSAYRWVTNGRLGGFDKKLAYDANRLREIYLSEGRRRYHTAANPKVLGEEDDFAPFYARKMTSALLNGTWWPAEQPISKMPANGKYYLERYRRKVVEDWNAYGASHATAAAQVTPASSSHSVSNKAVTPAEQVSPISGSKEEKPPQTDFGKKVKEIEEGADAAKNLLKKFGF